MDMATSHVAAVESPVTIGELFDGIQAENAAAEPQTQHAAAVLAFGRRCSGSGKLRVLVEEAVEMLGRVLQTDLSATGEVMADGSGMLRQVATETAAEPIPQMLSPRANESIAAFALTQLGPVASSDLAADDRFTDAPLSELGVAGALSVPLRVGRRQFGVLEFYTKEPREFGVSDLHFAEMISHLLTAAIARAQAASEPIAGVLSAGADVASSSFEPESNGDNRRSSPRREFRYRQLIAPMSGDTVPAENCFFSVLCEDISAGGISFYLDKRPAYDHIIVALGHAAAMTYFRARIVRITNQSLDGRPSHLIGCRFVGRVHP